MATITERARQRQAALTRERIAAIVRATIDAGITAYRMQHSVLGYTLEAWLTTIVKEKTTELDALLSEALIQKGKHPAWPAMVTVVEATHRPSSYVKDVYYHDREALEQKQPGVFAWSTRDTGTWLFIPGTGRDSCLEFARAAQGTGESHTWYWWNGKTLVDVDAQAALSRLVTAERTLARREEEAAVAASSRS